MRKRKPELCLSLVAIALLASFTSRVPSSRSPSQEELAVLQAVIDHLRKEYPGERPVVEPECDAFCFYTPSGLPAALQPAFDRRRKESEESQPIGVDLRGKLRSVEFSRQDEPGEVRYFAQRHPGCGGFYQLGLPIILNDQAAVTCSSSFKSCFAKWLAVIKRENGRWRVQSWTLGAIS